MALELTVIENIQKLTWNFEDIKKELTDSIAKYSNLVVSETNLPDMERTQREIASLRIKIGKFKTAVKKDYNKPFEVFELQVSELAKLVESAEKPIKDQLQKYEDQRRETKSAEIKQMIAEISTELGLGEKYSSQLVVADTYLNRGTKIKDIKEDIQSKVCWFLEIQTKEIAEEAARVEKINMAKMMVELLSKDLITPLTFESIENKIDQMNITELRTYIENQVAGRKEREERAKQVVLEQAEQKRIAEVARKEKAEQEAILKAEREAARQAEIEEAHKRQLAHKAEMEQQERDEQARKQAEFERNQELPKNSEEHLQKMHEANEIPKSIEIKPTDKLYNAQFVAYAVNKEQIDKIGCFIQSMGVEFKHAVREVK